MDDVLGRAQRDAGFLQRVREAHAGDWDVLDALWWESRPFDVAPSGARAPAAELRELQRRLFSQGGDASGDHATTAMMRELEGTIAAERAAVKAAIEHALGQSGAHPPQTDADVIRLLDPEQEWATGDPASEPTTVPEAAPAPKRNLAVGLSIAAALVGGVVVGIQLTGGTADAAPPAQSATPAMTAPRARTAPVVTPDVGAIAPVGVFDRDQADFDIPGLVMPGIFDAASFRNLSHVPDSEHQPPARIYAARTTSNMMCLVVVISADDYVSTCALERDFPSTGLRVHWKGPTDVMHLGGSEPVAVPTDQHAVWATDGSLMWGSVGA